MGKFWSGDGVSCVHTSAGTAAPHVPLAGEEEDPAASAIFFFLGWQNLLEQLLFKPAEIGFGVPPEA